VAHPQAGHADLAEAARMKAQSWVESYTGLIPDDVLRARTSEEAVARTEAAWRRDLDGGAYFWLVVTEGAVVGVAHACAARDTDAPQQLELALIYTLDVCKGSGIVDRLLEMAIGDSPAYLWVLRSNARAQAFYRRHGFVPDGTTKLGDPPDLTEERWVRA
jgi:GNAT superfamily N-acetyltransferase